MFSKLAVITLLCALFFSSISAKTYLRETFDSLDAWTTSAASSGKTLGKFTLEKGEFGEIQGAKTSEDYRHYAVARNFDEEFSTEGQTFVYQFTVKNEQVVDCAGQYVKIGMSPDLSDLSQLKDDTQYAFMFGPDKCGSTAKLHFIFQYKGKNLDWKKSLRPESDQLTHIYTFIVNPDNTYEVQVDGVKKESGSLEEDWDFLGPKQIPDPDEKKPEDWVDDAKIVDPTDEKPGDWDDEPKFIPDPEAEKPEDWDEEEDGEYEPAQIPNPKYKGEWTPKMIDNPDYKGVWAAQLIDNPDYVADDKLYAYSKVNWVAIEVWQVKAGTIFGNILVTDSVSEAKAEADSILEQMKAEKAESDAAAAEKRMKEEEERKAKEAEEKAKKAEEEETAKAQEEASEAEEETDEHDEL